MPFLFRTLGPYATASGVSLNTAQCPEPLFGVTTADCSARPTVAQRRANIVQVNQSTTPMPIVRFVSFQGERSLWRGKSRGRLGQPQYPALLPARTHRRLPSANRSSRPSSSKPVELTHSRPPIAFGQWWKWRWWYPIPVCCSL